MKKQLTSSVGRLDSAAAAEVLGKLLIAPIIDQDTSVRFFASLETLNDMVFEIREFSVCIISLQSSNESRIHQAVRKLLPSSFSSNWNATA
jgi:hypothetical protein